MPVLMRCPTAMPAVGKCDLGSCQRVSSVQNAGTQQYGVARGVRASRKSISAWLAVIRATK
jgi:hypothetical protein